MKFLCVYIDLMRILIVNWGLGIKFEDDVWSLGKS